MAKQVENFIVNQEALSLQKAQSDVLESQDFLPKLSDQTPIQDIVLVHQDEDSQQQNKPTTQFKDESQVIDHISEKFARLQSTMKDKLLFLENQLKPLLQAVQTGKLKPFEGLSFLELKYQVLLSYCLNISFCMLLKSKGESIQDHPVMTKILHHETLLKKLVPIEKKLDHTIQKYLALARSHSLDEIEADEVQTADVDQLDPILGLAPQLGRTAMTFDSDEDEDNDDDDFDDEEQALSLLQQAEEESKQRKSARSEFNIYGPQGPKAIEIMSEAEAESPLGVRYATKKIIENRGLSRIRPKHSRNPRLAAKRKYQKAVTKHHSQVARDRDQDQPFVGEKTGIQTHLARSTVYDDSSD